MKQSDAAMRTTPKAARNIAMVFGGFERTAFEFDAFVVSVRFTPP
jgi:hypothetical protein